MPFVPALLRSMLLRCRFFATCYLLPAANDDDAADDDDDNDNDDREI